jgi:hypothetical protein
MDYLRTLILILYFVLCKVLTYQGRGVDPSHVDPSRKWQWYLQTLPGGY